MIYKLPNKIRTFIYSVLRTLSRGIFRILPKEIWYSKVYYLIHDNLAKETFDHFKDIFKKTILFDSIDECRSYAIKNARENNQNNDGIYLEFGVYKGLSANFFSKYVNKLYVFDSFEGLKEDWVGTSAPKGSLNLDKNIPNLNSNIVPIVGWIEDTLDEFLKKHNPKISFVHIDVDTYRTTKYILERIKPHLKSGSVIIFDELYNYVGWEHGEYKALVEVFNKDEFSFKAFAIHSCRAVIQIN